MGWIAQKATRLSGVQYYPGDVVPDDIGSERLVRMGLVSAVPDAAVAGILAGSDAAVDAFDPSEHPVREVIQFVDAYPEQRERVLQAERRGENRKTLVAALEDDEPPRRAKSGAKGSAGDPDATATEIDPPEPPQKASRPSAASQGSPLSGDKPSAAEADPPTSPQRRNRGR